MPVSPRQRGPRTNCNRLHRKELAITDLYKFALFLQKDEFWNDQIDQIFVHPDGETELIPRVGSHRIVLGTLDDFETKLQNLKLFTIRPFLS